MQGVWILRKQEFLWLEVRLTEHSHWLELTSLLTNTEFLLSFEIFSAAWDSPLSLTPLLESPEERYKL